MAEASANPTTYARGRLSMLRTRWAAREGVATRRFAPRVAPGAPGEAFIGFTVGAFRLTENTTTALPAQSFHELGLWQVPGGPRDGPAPNPDPRAAHNAWGRLAVSLLVRDLLGRSAVMTNGGWKAAPEDQAAVGVGNILDDAAATAAKLPASVRPRQKGSHWHVALGIAGFSPGPAGMAAAIAPYATQLATVPESERWHAFARLLAADYAAGRVRETAGRGNHAYRCLRAAQKLAAGRELTAAMGGDAAWFGPRDEVTETAITSYAQRHQSATAGAATPAITVMPPSSNDIVTNAGSAPLSQFTMVAFAPGQLGAFASFPAGSNRVARKHNAAEALAAVAGAAVVLDGPMYEPANPPRSEPGYRGAQMLYSPADGLDVRGDWRGGVGATLVVEGSAARVVQGRVKPAGAQLAIQGYPALVIDGAEVHSDGSDEGNRWRAAVGVLNDGRAFFAAARGGNENFADTLLAKGARGAIYTDGGGSASLLVRGRTRIGDPEDRRVGVWLYARGGAAGGASSGSDGFGVVVLAGALAYAAAKALRG